MDELYLWKHGDPAHFFSRIFSLFEEADPRNYYALSAGFPMEALALELWHKTPDPESLFKFRTDNMAVKHKQALAEVKTLMDNCPPELQLRLRQLAELLEGHEKDKYPITPEEVAKAQTKKGKP